MLIVSRRPNERVDIFFEDKLIGTVVVRSLHESHVKLGLEACGKVKFMREELILKEDGKVPKIANIKTVITED
ncbi:MAG: hypothetical protein COV52_01800 [Gammaproteobacteria bacterium CG11_big_fil_rev_8_21_14_0_20_46_22]|nr:MAG: hypothetical protein COW05_05695 [Gammaproteobacteria bacterium CG12_big_fil_rev_8_21_14_0_65_46_12]PIR11848.1 MAG: hypothetical protein COV52_01800 [Gammaproteobacteria bacterium CG11_big_fil_rev_8_21_14_0_20_46_22]